MKIVKVKDLYSEAKQFLIEKLEEAGREDANEVLNLHLKPNPESADISSLKTVFIRLLGSWKNAQSKANVIGDLAALEGALFDFDHLKILHFYRTSCDGDTDKFLGHMVETSGKTNVRRAAKSHWPQFSKGVISAANFLSLFGEVEDFKIWVDKFYTDPDTRAALPLVLSSEIHGFGYALACDFLKEIGYTEFAKPDVHLKDVLVKFAICPPEAKDYVIHKRIVECAKEVEVTPYEFDKVIWLIGSGKFYNSKDDTGNELGIGNNKKKFYEWMKERNVSVA